MDLSAKQKIISVCIVGKPNAGKSSLLNYMVGQKISIVTPKVQTTRSIITGIVTTEDTQVIIIDTPGIFEPSKQFERAMVRCAWSSLHGTDCVMLIIDSTKKLDDALLLVLQRLNQLKIKPIFLLNKVDLDSKYIDYTEKYLSENFEDSPIFQISAISGSGIDVLMNYITSKALFGSWLYDQDDITNLPMRFLASEITREKLFLHLHEELPYNLTVQTEKWQDNKDKSVTIHQVIVVSKENYKMMILGKNGSKIKEIGSEARKEFEESFGIRAHIFLFVKVRESWENNPEFYNYMGLKFEQKK